MKRIILASQSEARKTLISSIGVNFVVKPAQIDEKKIRDADLVMRSQKIADAKAEKIMRMYPNDVVIACDTFSECGGKVFEKPQNIEEAYQMLTLLSGKSAINYTAMRYVDHDFGIDEKHVVTVKYSFRELYPQEIELYVRLFPVTDWAAAFALVHPYVTTFISSIEGSYTGIAYGLPMEIIIPLLVRSGFTPHPQKQILL